MSKKLNIALAYNLKKGSSSENPDDEAELDELSTVVSISNAIKEMGFEVELIEATAEFVRKITEKNFDMVFNFAEGLKGRGREAQIPAFLNLMEIPFTGSDETTLAIGLDKALCKRILGYENILTPKFQLFTSTDQKLNKKMKFPMIVKPNAEGSSKGINDMSVVNDEKELFKSLEFIINRYHCDALVEEYIVGREFTVGLIGNGDSLRVLPIMEIIFKDPDTKFYSYRVKSNTGIDTHMECPALIDKKLEKKIKKTAYEIFNILNSRDVARIDFRYSDEGKLYFIEINPLPGLVDGYSDLTTIAKADGMTYNELIQNILKEALKRECINL